MFRFTTHVPVLLAYARNGSIGEVGEALISVTAPAAYAMAEAFGWECSLDDKPHEAKQFYAVIAASTLAGVLINYAGINPISALFWTAVINGLVAPPLLVIIMLVANNPEVMGAKVNGPGTNVMGWAAAAAFSTSTAKTCVGPNMFERKTSHFPSGVKETLGSSS